MNWKVILCVVAFAGLSLDVFAQSKMLSEETRNRDTLDLLENTRTEIDFFETRLGDVLKSLHKDHDIQFWLDESAADNNLDRETLITATIDNVRLVTALDLMLHEFQCTWALRDGIVVVLSQDAALEDEFLNVFVFDCHEVTKRPSVEITELVRQAVNPDEWVQNGGYGRVVAVGDLLVVRQTSPNLLAVRRFLNQLREARFGKKSKSEPSPNSSPSSSDDPFADDAKDTDPFEDDAK